MAISILIFEFLSRSAFARLFPGPSSSLPSSVLLPLLLAIARLVLRSSPARMRGELELDVLLILLLLLGVWLLLGGVLAFRVNDWTLKLEIRKLRLGVSEDRIRARRRRWRGRELERTERSDGEGEGGGEGVESEEDEDEEAGE